MNVKWPDLWAYAPAIGMAILVVLVARAVVVYGVGMLLRFLGHELPFHYLHVLLWGGLRGAVSLALAFTLLEHPIPARQQVLAMTFGVVLFTLLVQGTTVRFLVERLGLVGLPAAVREYERLQGELLALRAARRHLNALREEGVLIPQAWQTVTDRLGRREAEVEQRIQDLLQAHPNLAQEAIHLAWEEALRAQRAALLRMRAEGTLHADVVDELIAEVDAALAGERRPMEQASAG